MNNKKYLINSLSYVTLANLFSMLVTAFLTLVVPRFVNVYNYGLWQLFIFYQGYLGFFHFGWNDGLYLKYGGREYDSLPKQSLYSQFWLQILFEVILSAGLLVVLQTGDADKRYIYWQLAINMVVLNSRYMLFYLLQATGRIKEYALILLTERFLYVIFIVFALLKEGLGFQNLIISDTISKSISYIVAICFCRDIIFRKLNTFRVELKEIFSNIDIGIKLLFSNIASMLIIGICRWGIEKNWGVEVFGEVSLSMTLSQLFITFVSNVGLVIFPLLRRMDEKKLGETYVNLKLCLSVLFVTAFSLFYPGKLLLEQWLPAYSQSIEYMGLLLPICFYESKMALLNNPYLKSMRREKMIMMINCCVMAMSFILTFAFAFVLKNLILSVMSILVLIILRCVWSERVVCKGIKIATHPLANMENLMMLVFVIANFLIRGWMGFSIYLLLAVVYLGYNKKRFIE